LINNNRIDSTTRILRERYSLVSKDSNERIMEAIHKLLQSSRNPNQSIHAFLEDAARMTHRLFDFQEIAIGLRNNKDKMYRFEILIGFRDEAEKALRKCAYTHEEMTNLDKYPGGIQINKYTFIFLSEIQSFRQGEENTFNRPSLLFRNRIAPDDFIEGDYIDVHIFGRNNDVIGWIELSYPRSGKIPDRSTVKWLEMISALISSVILEKDFGHSIS